MTLERWSVHRYQHPHLDVHAIRRVDRAVEVDSSRGIFNLACEDAETVDLALLPVLDSLRDPQSPLWSAVRLRTAGADELIPMLTDLDNLGLIRESAAPDVRTATEEIEYALFEWSATLGRELSEQGEEATRIVEQLVDRLDQNASRITALGESNFAAVTLLLQARYLRQDAPSVLALLLEGLRAAVRRALSGEASLWWNGIGDLPSWAREEWTCGLTEPALVKRYLAATGAMLHDAFAHDAKQLAINLRSTQKPLSGINFVIELEGEVARLLTKLGPSPALAAVRDPARARKLVVGAFLQEYFVTCRFVEIVAPLLSKRFAEPLRDSVHRYFAEEMGHEHFERENCIRLGMTAEQIDASTPLPLYLAYIDILTGLARESPISFFCASMFTEGVIGSGASLVSLAVEAIPDDVELIRAIGDHVAVNEESDHRGVGRDWMSRVPVVNAETQHEVTAMIAYLAELNWRMWAQLTASIEA